MSSVTRFLRQIPAGLQYYTIAGSSSVTPYEFVPTAGNYTGNYFPGAMVAMTGAGGAATYSIVAGSILRDMGKTVTAPTATSVSNAQGAVYAATSTQKWREYQVITPAVTPDYSVQGTSTTPDAYSQYYTVYLPITVMDQGVSTPALVPIAGGQM